MSIYSQQNQLVDIQRKRDSEALDNAVRSWMKKDQARFMVAVCNCKSLGYSDSFIACHVRRGAYDEPLESLAEDIKYQRIYSRVKSIYQSSGESITSAKAESMKLKKKKEAQAKNEQAHVASACLKDRTKDGDKENTKPASFNIDSILDLLLKEDTDDQDIPDSSNNNNEDMEVLCLAFDTVGDICSDLEAVALELKQKLHQTYCYLDNTIFGPEETMTDVKQAAFYLTDTELLI